MDGLNSVKDRLAAVNQAHLLAHISKLESAEIAALLAEIQSLDLESLPALISKDVLARAALEVPSGIQPPLWYPLDPNEDSRSYEATRFHQIGEELIRAGKVAVFCVAGGQGTRLGWDGPKGTFPATPIQGKSLFQGFAEQLLNARVKYGRDIPWYIMTSPMNHGTTVAYFNEKHYFGLEPGSVRFFPQGVMPAFGADTGKILLAERGRIAFSPDGHGGSLRALGQSGALAEMRAGGVEIISYIQVDNPHVRALDALFIGLHAAADDSSAEMSSKMVPKTEPKEKLGNFCRTADGRTMVIEYTDLPDELAEQVDANGELRFRAGSIAIHCLGVDFIERLNDPKSGIALPWHRAEKKVATIDSENGEVITPTQPNAVKLEMFVFDALALCESSIILETGRVEEFAPIKNLSGVDSAESARVLQMERHARWLEAAGVVVARDETSGDLLAQIEISGLTAVEAGDLSGLDLPARIEAGESFSI